MKPTLRILPILLLACSAATAQSPEWFDDVTEQVGLDSVSTWRIYVADVDGDVYPDIVTLEGIYRRNQLKLFLNRPVDPDNPAAGRHFIDFTEESGINENRIDSIDHRAADVAALADVDNDGDVDLVTSRFYYAYNDYVHPEDRSDVMLNDGTGRFTFLPKNGLHESEYLNATGLAFLDYDRDGVLDLYAGTFSWDQSMSIYMEDYLFRGNGNGRFTDVTAVAGIDAIAQPLYGVNVADWNNDGWPDVLTSPYCRTAGSLWKNNGDGTFTDVATAANYSAKHMQGDHGQNLCQWEAMPADFDNDGDIDILQVFVHGGMADSEGRTVIAVNQGPDEDYRLEWDLSLLDRGAPSSSHFGDMSASWIDFDNDGLLDVVIAQSQYPQANQAGVERTYFMRQNQDHTFTEIASDLGLLDSLLAPGATQPIDYDLDGDEDLLVIRNTNRNQNNELRILQNNATGENSWIGVRLLAPAAINSDAIGARVRVITQQDTQMRELAAGHGHFGGQSPLWVTFGLGVRTSVERIEIDWPGDHPMTVVENPPLNQYLLIDGSGISAIMTESGPVWLDLR